MLFYFKPCSDRSKVKEKTKIFDVCRLFLRLFYCCLVFFAFAPVVAWCESVLNVCSVVSIFRNVLIKSLNNDTNFLGNRTNLNGFIDASKMFQDSQKTVLQLNKAVTCWCVHMGRPSMHKVNRIGISS